jgi:chromate transporter
MLWKLFLTFFKIGCMSFGGGYAMIPVIQHESEANGWLTSEQFSHAISLAGMSPGPIATNAATLIGYESAGVLGAVDSTLGMVLPSLLIIVILASFFYKMDKNKQVRSIFYGLKPVVTALIVYAAIHFGFSSHGGSLFTWKYAAILFMAAGVFIAVLKYKLYPLTAILLSGLIGIALFS